MPSEEREEGLEGDQIADEQPVRRGTANDVFESMAEDDDTKGSEADKADEQPGEGAKADDEKTQASKTSEAAEAPDAEKGTSAEEEDFVTVMVGADEKSGAKGYAMRVHKDDVDKLSLYDLKQRESVEFHRSRYNQLATDKDKDKARKNGAAEGDEKPEADAPPAIDRAKVKQAMVKHANAGELDLMLDAAMPLIEERVGHKLSALEKAHLEREASLIDTIEGLSQRIHRIAAPAEEEFLHREEVQFLTEEGFTVEAEGGAKVPFFTDEEVKMISDATAVEFAEKSKGLTSQASIQALGQSLFLTHANRLYRQLLPERLKAPAAPAAETKATADETKRRAPRRMADSPSSAHVPSTSGAETASRGASQNDIFAHMP
jgi:hypothetical protein